MNIIKRISMTLEGCQKLKTRWLTKKKETQVIIKM